MGNMNSLSKILLRLLFIMVTGSSATVLGAQDKQTLLSKAMGFISAPSRELDPEAVIQPAPSWTLSLSGDLRKFSVSQKSDFIVLMTYMDDIGDFGQTPLPSSLSSSLRSNVNKSAGFQVGYGNLTLGWNQSFGMSKELKQKVFSFDYTGAAYAAQLQYFDYQEYMEYDFEVAPKDDPNHFEEHARSEKPCRYRSLIADGFYAFNQRTFAYSAAYKGNKIQRRSSGSFMSGIKLIQGMLEVDPHDRILDLVAGVGRQTTTQVAFGGGYSYNLVPYHRDPDPQTGKGLRNITLNLTAIPMVTLFNQFASTVYIYEGYSDLSERKSYMNGNLMVNYVARAGLIYSWDKYSVCASGSYDSYSYKGRTKILLTGLSDDHIKNSGRFGRWTAGIRFNVRF